MTSVGKVLVVVQLALSVCFMAFAGAVYTAETNWATKAGKLEEQVKKVQSDLSNQTQDLQKTITEKDAEAGKLNDQVALLDKKLKDSDDARGRLTTEIEAARTGVDQQTAAATLAEEQAVFRLEEAMRQRERNALLHTQVNGQLEKTRGLEDELFAKNLSIDAMQNKHQQALEQIAALRTLLNKDKIDGGGNNGLLPGAGGATAPPAVRGKVLDTKRSPTTKTEFVLISLGSDDGFNVGDELYVYRDDTYLGRLAITEVTPDKAITKVIERVRNGTIQEGDNVSAQL